MEKTNEILTIAGKKVMVRYTRDGQPCEKCVFGESDNLCAHAKDKCVELDMVGMEIDERAYFVPAEEDDKEFCKDNCKGYQETGRCFADDDCKAKQEADLKASIAPEDDLDAEIERYEELNHGFEGSSRADCLNIARHFAEWGVEHADKPIYEVSSRGKSAMGDKFFDWLQFGTHAIWDWMVKTDWYKKLNDMSDELIVKIYLGKKHSKK